ncbi:MAG: hypothetical protein IAX21_03810 [Candidatus Bathyarchaeota archaeon]|nr:MAG: hypothetical protein IAX21_03810 [Candidatus Bathyarchaeota archaeon]
MSASEIQLSINKKVGTTYIPRKLRSQFGLKPIVFPDHKAAILYSEDTDPNEVIRSLEVLIQHLKLRIEPTH